MFSKIFNKKKKEEPKTLSQAMKKTRNRFFGELKSIFSFKKTMDDSLFEAIETLLLTADLGIETTDFIIKNLIKSCSRQDLKDSMSVFNTLKKQMVHLLEPVQISLTIPKQNLPFVILMVGINGAGKTTTIGKLAYHLKKQGHKVLLAAGDTFRAAAVEQLTAWGDRYTIPVIKQPQGSDSAAVIYDAFLAAKARNIDVVIADTAGRLPNKMHLMEELKKIKRVLQKKGSNELPQEIQLVIDASIGQNSLKQALSFHEALHLTGLIVTKLDGSAKAGIIFSIAKQLNLPIHYLGIGEKADDLIPFNANAFVTTLMDDIN